MKKGVHRGQIGRKEEEILRHVEDTQQIEDSEMTDQSKIVLILGADG